jgi:acyl-CoA synthetase (AMP-forming)/AMP-acid ligase II
VTHLFTTPTLYRRLLDRLGSGDLRPAKVSLRGERVPAKLIARHFELMPDAELHSEYVSPRDSATVAVRRIEGPHDTRPLIGAPLPGRALDLLDPDGRLVPFCCPGEICVGGARDERLLRTGDLARRLADGTVEYLGRVADSLRFNPDTVAEVLCEAEGVRAAVVVGEASEDGGQHPVAYLVGTADPARLRSFAARRLPAAAVPARFVVRADPPLTEDGRLDRAALIAAEAADSDIDELWGTTSYAF